MPVLLEAGDRVTVWMSGAPMDWERERGATEAPQLFIDTHPLVSISCGEAVEATAMLENVHGLGLEVERCSGWEATVEVACGGRATSEVDWGVGSGECDCCGRCVDVVSAWRGGADWGRDTWGRSPSGRHCERDST